MHLTPSASFELDVTLLSWWSCDTAEHSSFPCGCCVHSGGVAQSWNTCTMKKKSLLGGKWRADILNSTPSSYHEKYWREIKKKIKQKPDILYFYYNFNNMSKLKSVSKAITWRGSNKVVQATTYFDCWIKLNKAGCFDEFLASTNIIGSDIFCFNGNGLLWAGNFIISWKEKK